ncbi:hypothetical protein DIZ27_03105 [Streptomyces sp. NWU339]|uniref:hypothetical protein n=1 Tax=Streptomyces sp. NWU339 TaxID=2185284 RepID=UPI000D674339|nr:hypothetical protein [Streptomyces sp. NWU339]PWI11730.1 hypothetical protein DIZ27_03105 [Streptomyces sp. NWU339]
MTTLPGGERLIDCSARSSTLAAPYTSGTRDSGQARHPHGIEHDRFTRHDHSPDRRCPSSRYRVVRSSDQVTAVTVRWLVRIDSVLGRS